MNEHQDLVNLNTLFCSRGLVHILRHYFLKNLLFGKDVIKTVCSSYPKSRCMIVKVICDIYLVISYVVVLLSLIVLISLVLFIRVKTNDLYLINKSAIVVLLNHTVLILIVESLSWNNVCINVLLILWQILDSLFVNFGASPFPHWIDLY